MALRSVLVMMELAIVEALTHEAVARLAACGDRGTCGPVGSIPPPAPEPPQVIPPRGFLDGWWAQARHLPAHARRAGGIIDPEAVVVHTTDMLPAEWLALIEAWTKRPGDGACAHFLVGRSAAEGVIQLIPINRNGNHAGGAGRGEFVVGGKSVHPNVYSVGIEIHCAGGVQRLNGQWRLVEGGKAHGAPLPEADVIPDPARPGRGWHVVTDFQRAMVRMLLEDLHEHLKPLTAGAKAHSLTEAVPAYGVPVSARFVGHVSLAPASRADPWPVQMQWLNQFARSV